MNGYDCAAGISCVLGTCVTVIIAIALAVMNERDKCEGCRNKTPADAEEHKPEQLVSGYEFYDTRQYGQIAPHHCPICKRTLYERNVESNVIFCQTCGTIYPQPDQLLDTINDLLAEIKKLRADQ